MIFLRFILNNRGSKFIYGKKQVHCWIIKLKTKQKMYSVDFQ